MNRFAAASRRFTVGAVVAALLAGGIVTLGATSAATAADELPSPATTLQRDDNVVTADPLPTVQIDSGYVWAQTTIGNTVYAAGSFSNARAALAAPGTNLTPRTNILAFDIRTGALLSFAPSVNGVIRAVAASPDGTRLYIGGSFTQVNGETRWNFAVLDAQTGALIPGVSPAIGGSGVYAIAATASTVYVGGAFTQGNGVARKNLAAFAASNGALTQWQPTTDLQVDAMVMEPGNNRVIIGGRFYTVNGAVQRGLAALDPGNSGAVDTGWVAPQTIVNGWNSGGDAGKAGIFALTTDATGVYGTGWVYANATVGNLEGTFAADAGTGAVRWVADCHGDHYGVYSTGEVVYATSHTHACDTVGLWPEQSNRQYRYAEAYTADARGILTRSPSSGSTYKDWSGTKSPAAYIWYPDFTTGTASGLGQAGLSITGSGEYISIAGEFGSVNNQRYQGIVRFSTSPSTGAKQGPRIAAADWGTPTASTAAPGRIRVSIAANWDRDDKDLIYELLRDGSNTPVATTTVSSGWWSRPTVVLNDKGLDPGTSHTYQVRVKDADGNTVTSQSVSAVAPTGTATAYTDAVLDDGATIYYPMGSTAADWAGSNPPTASSWVSNTAGGVVGATSTSATQFGGSSLSRYSTTNTVPTPTTFSTELWFKTSTNRGGKLIGYGNQRSSDSGSYDRHVYMLNNGRLAFGVYNGSTQVITSPSSYNDNQWHQVVSSLGEDGMKLYVDGTLVASNSSVTTAESTTGYWRIGGDNLGSWPDRPSSDYFSGAIDEVSVYQQPLTAAQVAAHNAAGRGLESPTAGFTSSADGLTASVDASTSSVPSGRTITSYDWNWGDGSTGTGVTASHEYAAAGTYSVTLTITDSLGLTSTQIGNVTVERPNQAPTAAFTTSTSGLTVSANGSGSTDSDGTIASYSWNWGDGSAASTGATATHAYTEAGSYTVTLTVSDDDGATDVTTKSVTVSHAAPVAALTTTATGLVVQANASASTATDGATLSYAWNWGDGSTSGTGATPSHTYADAGTYTVTVTVTDSLGASSTATSSVTATTTVYAARDTFGRSVASGWGSADTGGLWSAMYGAASAGSVAGGVGTITLTPGNTRNFALQSLSLTDTTTTVTFTPTAAPSVGGRYAGVTARQSASNDYTTRAWLRNDGTVWLVIQRSGTVLTAGAVSGTWAAGDTFTLKTQVSGTSPTTIRAKLWKSGTTEPTAWQYTATDSTAALQQPGYVGVHYALGASATGTAALSFDDYRVVNDAAPAVNVPPVASFTSSVADLTVSVDGSASSDSDGTVASYAWSWGDGSAAGSGKTATHAYTAAGTYTVTLTVTDDDGATHQKSSSVTVTAPAQPNTALAADGFGRTVASGWGTADTGGAWSVLFGAASSLSVSDGAGRISLNASESRNAMLPGTDYADVDMQVDLSLAQAPADGAAYTGLVARYSTSDANYTVRVWLRNDGSVWLVPQRGSTVLAAVPVSGLTRAAGDSFTLRASITGSSPTTIKAKIWRTGTTEPANWQVTATDSTAGVQGTGRIGIHAYRSGSATTGQFTFDDFVVH